MPPVVCAVVERYVLVVEDEPTTRELDSIGVGGRDVQKELGPRSRRCASDWSQRKRYGDVEPDDLPAPNKPVSGDTRRCQNACGGGDVPKDLGPGRATRGINPEGVRPMARREERLLGK